MSPTKHFNRNDAREFALKYRDASSEKQLGQSFWRDFFERVCGVQDLLSTGIEFEFPTRSTQTGKINFIDVLWSGVVLIEHKSRGKSLEEAEAQAREYLASLPRNRQAPVILVSDFARIRIIDALRGTSFEFLLEDLPTHLDRIENMLAANIKEAVREEISADAEAVSHMTKLYVELERAEYDSHTISVFLIRVLFLNFGDDTGTWARPGAGLFEQIVKDSPDSGQGLGATIQELFSILDTPLDMRPKNLPPGMALFPYVNGNLFSEQIQIISFDSALRSALLETTKYDWSNISPAIFGAMFQTVKDKVDRRELGEHYTSEVNILKLIRPLFLDELTATLDAAWDSIPRLRAFRETLSKKRYFDPAAGSGNFLIVTYKALRSLELRALARLQHLGGLPAQEGFAGFGDFGLSVRLEQFHGIEIVEWSSQIATVAMYLADRQSNIELETIMGSSPNRFPLRESAKIVRGNALELDWEDVCDIDSNTYIFGNPPFYGARQQTEAQRRETLAVWQGARGAANLDYVTNWLRKAAPLIRDYGIRAAFVATNSITQGQQPPIIWKELQSFGIEYSFAHRSFLWTNESKDQAAVHVVIVGLSKLSKSRKKDLWSYQRPDSEPKHSEVTNINAYLIDAPSILVEERTKPLSSGTQPLIYGSMPNDNGFLSKISADEAARIRATDPIAAKYLRRLVGATEFLNGKDRYCLWLTNASPTEMRASQEILQRIAGVREHRENSDRETTKREASRSHEFAEIRQPKTSYVVVPRHSSENRDYVPVGWMDSETITNDAVSLVPSASLVTFGWLASRSFSLWNKAVSGRIKSDVRISSKVTYNNFPFPTLSDSQRAEIEVAAQEVLDARATFTISSLADLYDSAVTPTALLKAHAKLDRATEKSLGLRGDNSEEKILGRLFALYITETQGLLAKKPRARRI